MHLFKFIWDEFSFEETLSLLVMMTISCSPFVLDIMPCTYHKWAHLVQLNLSPKRIRRVPLLGLVPINRGWKCGSESLGCVQSQIVFSEWPRSWSWTVWLIKASVRGSTAELNCWSPWDAQHTVSVLAHGPRGHPTSRTGLSAEGTVQLRSIFVCKTGCPEMKIYLGLALHRVRVLKEAHKTVQHTKSFRR